MQGVKKIMEEINNHAIEFKAFGITDDYVSTEWVKDIIRNNMNNGWIPVEKKMPEEEGVYLVTLKEGEKVTLLGYGNCRRDVLGKPIGFGWYYCATATYFSEDAVIAWRPLPDPYKKRGKNERYSKKHK